MFDLDFMTGVLTDHNQASSRGAVGATARERSADPDRSRDPLYNQLKMYSEVYRMLGWLRPGNRRLEFSTTILGDLIAEDFAHRSDLVYGLLRQCLLSITFPNPATDNIGVTNHRPFRWLLLVAASMNNVITRHEMILGLLAVTDDRMDAALDDAVARIEVVRGGNRSVLDSAVARYAAAEGVQVTTLENYTRLPVGVMKSAQIGWGSSARVAGLYDRPIEALTLSALGSGTAEWLAGVRDVREADLAAFPYDDRAHFANYAYYAMLIRAGVQPSRVDTELRRAETGAAVVLESLGIGGPDDFLYSPVQEASQELLARAETVE